MPSVVFGVSGLLFDRDLSIFGCIFGSVLMHVMLLSGLSFFFSATGYSFVAFPRVWQEQ